MNAAEIARQDQLDAREREFDRKAQKVAIVGLTIFVLLGLYSLLALLGYLPVAPWSPAAQ